MSEHIHKWIVKDYGVWCDICGAYSSAKELGSMCSHYQQELINLHAKLEIAKELLLELDKFTLENHIWACGIRGKIEEARQKLEEK